jgi:molybdate transport system substrate-binding protein
VRSTLVRALVIASLAAACSGPVGSAAPRTPAGSEAVATPGGSVATISRHLTILGAASLKSVLDDAKVAYESANPGTTLVMTTDSSAALEAQIEQGAYADVFLSADTANPQKLVDGGFTEGEAIAFAGNKLTIVVPTDNPAGITSWQDLAEGAVKVIAAGEEVPITSYANQLIGNLAALPDAPAGFADAYAANIVSREENVKALIAKIELGEGDAGIVYTTDAQASTKVSPVAVPDEANVPATYAGVVVKISDDIQRAEGFLDWFAGPDGQAILARYGFLPPPEE